MAMRRDDVIWTLAIALAAIVTRDCMVGVAIPKAG